ncbi:MAG: hypothetical protein WDN28_25420 [Chthoniobacter sp.]
MRAQVNAFLADYQAKGGFEKLGDKWLSEQKSRVPKTRRAVCVLSPPTSIQSQFLQVSRAMPGSEHFHAPGCFIRLVKDEIGRQ